MSLIVVDPGLASRVVDFGRPRSRALGVPVGGAADRLSFIIGNGLVGNAPDAPALEVCLKGPVLRAEAPVGCVLFGAPFTISSARQVLACGTTFSMEQGEEIHIGAASGGMRAYLCVRGGFHVPEILGSRSALENLTAGAMLPCAPSLIHRRFVTHFGRPQGAGVLLLPSPPPIGDVNPVKDSLGGGEGLGVRGRTIHVTAGLQASWFDPSEFFGQEFVVSSAADRMGIRLLGQALTVPKRELVSEPVGPGAVQVTSDGQGIVLGVDGQTIGGYPKIAHVIQADWDILGQLRPGERLRFRQVTLDEATERFRERRAWLDEWAMRLRVSLAGTSN